MAIPTSEMLRMVAQSFFPIFIIGPYEMNKYDTNITEMMLKAGINVLKKCAANTDINRPRPGMERYTERLRCDIISPRLFPVILSLILNFAAQADKNTMIIQSDTPNIG